ncbi:hypothetical protein [Streptomyces sp. NPDC005336]|uniref:hypothetical protein n=1 Tax=Streptomyces sp. NPDC005336 TaxID=3157035 RepID=UPI0033A004FF
METTSSYVVTRPGGFGMMLSTLLCERWGDLLRYDSGVNLSHPASLLEAVASFQITEAQRTRTGFPSYPMLGLGRTYAGGVNARRLP